MPLKIFKSRSIQIKFDRRSTWLILTLEEVHPKRLHLSKWSTGEILYDSSYTLSMALDLRRGKRQTTIERRHYLLCVCAIYFQDREAEKNRNQFSLLKTINTVFTGPNVYFLLCSTLSSPETGQQLEEVWNNSFIKQMQNQFLKYVQGWPPQMFALELFIFSLSTFTCKMYFILSQAFWARAVFRFICFITARQQGGNNNQDFPAREESKEREKKDFTERMWSFPPSNNLESTHTS